MQAKTLLLVAAVSLIGCKKKGEDAPAPKVEEPAKPTPTPPPDKPKEEPKAPPPAANKLMDGIHAVKPALPKGADAFEWVREEPPGDKSDTWRLMEKAAPKGVALILEIDDESEKVKSADPPTFKTKFGEFPADRGTDWVRTLAGNVEAQVSMGSKLGAFAKDDKAKTAVLDEVLTSLDLKALSKL